ncbi:MAG: hypothetical protein M3419_01125, partial [Actinomycetota bacterium]|nr:hypothetical protein [Actinomycetota bacterium]
GMPGREPMNPRGRQFGLGGSVEGWVRLTRPEPRQARLLRRAYRGLEPRTLSRYGIRQFAAATPWTCTIVKDPFALLSIPAVVRLTGARPVLLYRNPCAVLASYRRMGWLADVDEVVALGATHLRAGDGDEVCDDADAMAVFWCFLNDTALGDLHDIEQATVVSHEELIRGGDAAVATLRRHLQLPPAAAAAPAVTRDSTAGVDLHRFDRARDEVLHGWRSRLSVEEDARVQRLTRGTLERLEQARLLLLPDPPAAATKRPR